MKQVSKPNIDHERLEAIIEHMRDRYGRGMIEDIIYTYSLQADHNDDSTYGELYRDMEELIATLFPDYDWIEDRKFKIPLKEKPAKSWNPPWKRDNVKIQRKT